MALDIRKWFIPFSVANRGRKTSVQKNNVDGIIYNDALSISRMFTEVHRSEFGRTNYSTYDEVTTIGTSDQSSSIQLSNKGYHIVTPAADSEGVKLASHTDTMLVTVHNVDAANNLIVHVSEGDSLNGVVDDNFILAAGETAVLIGISNSNWVRLI